jgi:hypothetical protein
MLAAINWLLVVASLAGVSALDFGLHKGTTSIQTKSETCRKVFFPTHKKLRAIKDIYAEIKEVRRAVCYCL